MTSENQKLKLKKYNPVKRKHELFVEAKLPTVNKAMTKEAVKTRTNTQLEYPPDIMLSFIMMIIHQWNLLLNC